MKKLLVLFPAMGILYICSEVVFNALSFQFRGDVDYFTLKGSTTLWMFPIGGFTMLLLAWMNQSAFFQKHINVFWQSVAGALIILAVEFVSGCIVNLLFGLNCWNYNNYPYNVFGQICLPFGILWFLASPLAFWVDDQLNLLYYKTGQEYTIIQAYIDLWEPCSDPQYLHFTKKEGESN